MSKKKIGIITFWESNTNYGQQLQCWALQHYLREQGYDAFLIRQYVWLRPSKKKGIKRVKQWIKDKIAAVLYLTNLAYNSKIAKRFTVCLDKDICRRQFPRFRSQYLKMTKTFKTPEELVANPPIADVYITGSDQVWNYSMMSTEILKNFFLQFGNKNTRRIAYAPSIGHTDFSDEIKDVIKPYLSDITSISVRESSAVSILQQLGYKAKHVLDPTMLLQAKDYFKLIEDEPKRRSIFIYSVNYESRDDLPFDEIKNYAQQKSLPIIVTTADGFVPEKELFEEVEYCYAIIPQWIQLINNADIVIAGSFHAIVFSILMHTPFIYTPLKGAHAESNRRVLDLLEELGLEQTIFVGRFNPQINIDWDSVDDKLNQMRKASTEYLLNSIEQ